MARDDPPEVRIEEMAQWAAGIDEQIIDLQSKVKLGDHALADAISAELGDLFSQYKEASQEIRNAELRRVEIASEVAEYNDSLDVLKASVALEVAAELGDNGKPKHSNQAARDNAAMVRLGYDEKYGELVSKVRELELESAILKAQVADWERGLSEYRNRNRALVARLNNLTARLAQ